MKALCFGEILFDVFKEEKKIGGAPLNVAGHIRRLGGDSEIISALGLDELGDEASRYLEKLEVGTKYVKRVKEETGKAIISLKDGIPSYVFNFPAAWDRIFLTEEDKENLRNESYDVFVFGSLAQRQEESRRSLSWLLENINAKYIFFDVNLRLDFYDRDIIEAGIKKADILKMNDEEVPVIRDLLGMEDEDFIARLMKKYDLKMVLLTCGKDGTYLHLKDKVLHQEIRKVKVVDTVGAGDSLSSGFLYYLASGEDLDKVLRKASYLADYVVQHQGAIPEYEENFQKELDDL